MVGLVLVSHSQALAQALILLVRQVAAETLSIAAAGGVGSNRQEFGTDAVDIARAIESVDSPDGVVVLMDLGSAVLSAETAMELLSDERRARVRLCPAPIVEGAIAAGVQISLGSDLKTVCREARAALDPKIQQISLPTETLGEENAANYETVALGQRQQIRVTVRTPHGLHARPAARFVQTAAAFKADVRVAKHPTGALPVPATSLNSLTTLGVAAGEDLWISARGPQAAEALEALRRLVEEELTQKDGRQFAEPKISPATRSSSGGMTVAAISEGFAVGPAWQLQTTRTDIPQHPAGDRDGEWQRLQQAIAATDRRLDRRRAETADRLGAAQAEIFAAHRLMLQDPVLLERARDGIIRDGLNAAAAWHRSVAETADAYRSLVDGYLRQRAVDMLDLGRQVLSELLGHEAPETAMLTEPAVLTARELSPNQISGLDRDNLLALVTVEGSPNSHAAILARGLAIPTVSAADPSVLDLPDGTLLAVDATQGVLWVHPTPECRRELESKRRAWLKTQDDLRRASLRPAVTRDGRRITVAANIASVAAAVVAAESGAEEIGLLRTEFLYMARDKAPGEQELVEALCEIGRRMNHRPVCVRTLDIGGDKPIPYLPRLRESNPFLGVRGIRRTLRCPDLFRIQLRAILRAAAEVNLRVMFPMVSTMDDVLQALEALRSARAELVQQSVAHAWPVVTGTMVETPAAALLTEAFGRHLDFFSIGTNDLTQYTLAAERGHPALSAYADAFHPAVLRLIRRVVQAAHQLAKPVAVCGELASDPLAIPVLVGLGVDDLSVNPAAVPRTKSIIHRLNGAEAAALAETVLQADSAPAARRIAAHTI
jgi:phosphoenolpyruvate-protein phosphotransferase/dihydroxyacetone kinase phosphotransfer subunit